MKVIDQLWRSEMDTRLFRLVLRAARDGAPVQDVIDCADLARIAGHDAIAANLAGLAALQAGAGGTVRAGFSVDLAIDELRALMPLRPQLAEDDIRMPPADAGPHQRPGVAPPDLARLTGRVDALLAAVPRLLVDGGLAAVLLGVAEDVAASTPLPPDEHLAADLATLASLLGLHHLRRFLSANRSLLRAENGGQPLLEASARLGPGALGPYFTNVRMLIRNARDVFALVEAAGGAPTHDEIETWCVLLSAHLGHHQLVDLADELGDRGMARALRLMLSRLAWADGPRYPLDPVWRIRDVCLDLAEWRIAGDAQQLIALWRPRDPNEWRILAEIRATVDDATGVEGALERALLMAPDDPATRKRMAAWQAGVMPPIAGGYGSSPGRRRLRQARIEAYRKVG